MDFSYDTEFLNAGGETKLVSAAFVSTSGAELYLVNAEMDWDEIAAHPWMNENVLPHLPPRDDPAWQSRKEIARQVEEFLDAECRGEEGYLWAWNGAYDKVLLANLWDHLLAAPRPFKFTYDLKQLWIHLGRPEIPEQTGDLHDALEDSRGGIEIFKVLAAEAERKGIPLH